MRHSQPRENTTPSVIPLTVPVVTAVVPPIPETIVKETPGVTTPT